MVGLADLDAGAPDLLAIFDEVGVKAGDVDDQVVVREVATDPTHALEAGTELVDAGLDRNIELLDAAWPHLAVGVDSVAHLGVFDRSFQILVEDLRIGRVGPGEVAGDAKPCPKGGDPRPDGVDLEHGSGRYR